MTIISYGFQKLKNFLTPNFRYNEASRYTVFWSKKQLCSSKPCNLIIHNHEKKGIISLVFYTSKSMHLKFFGPNSKAQITKIRVSQGLASRQCFLNLCRKKNNHNPFPDPLEYSVKLLVENVGILHVLDVLESGLHVLLQHLVTFLFSTQFVQKKFVKTHGFQYQIGYWA